MFIYRIQLNPLANPNMIDYDVIRFHAYRSLKPKSLAALRSKINGIGLG
jgi:hypothetical protein